MCEVELPSRIYAHFLLFIQLLFFCFMFVTEVVHFTQVVYLPFDFDDFVNLMIMSCCSLHKSTASFLFHTL